MNTDANGKATAPSAVVAGTVPGVFVATITAGNATTTVPMVAQYGISAFESPVNNGANAVNGGSGNLPLKFSALLANNAKVSDSEAASLPAGCSCGGGSPAPRVAWSTRGGLAVYDPSPDLVHSSISRRGALAGRRTACSTSRCGSCRRRRRRSRSATTPG